MLVWRAAGGGLVYWGKRGFLKGTRYWSEAFGNCRRDSVVSFACRPLEWMDVEVGCFSVMILGLFTKQRYDVIDKQAPLSLITRIFLE